MITRLRPAHTPERLAEIYARPHDSSRWPHHRLRVAVTIQIANALAPEIASAADLSCGDGAVLIDVKARRRYFGDLAPGHELTGPIEETVHLIPRVDLFVCCETLEHVEDPVKLLHTIRPVARRLILSTPVDAWEDPNPEHYWAWSAADVSDMLRDAGFRISVYNELDLRPPHVGRPTEAGVYAFGIWGCF